ncbi:MAG: tetratricopeptide repeat protein [bacterium]
MVEQKKTLHASPTWLVQFGERLERARGHTGLTQTDLAGSELSKSFVSLLETARSYPSVETLLLLAGRSGVSVGSLLLESADLRLDTALSLLSVAGDALWRRPAWARGLLRTVEELLPDVPLRIRSEVLFLRGLTFVAENQLKEAQTQGDEARRFAQKAKFAPGVARATALLGHVSMLRRDVPSAMTQLSDAVEGFRGSGSLRSEFGIRTLLWLGTTSIHAGRVRYARGVYEKARRLAARLRLRSLEGRALWGLGHQAWVEGDLGKAARLLREAKAVFEKTEDLVDLGEVMRNLGVLLREQGKLSESSKALEHAIRLAEDAGNLRMRSSALQELARLHLQLGDVEKAEAHAQTAATLAHAAGDKDHRARGIALLGRIAGARGDRPAALRQLRQAARIFGSLRLKDAAAEVKRDLALLRSAQPPETIADHYLAQAIGKAPSRPSARRPAIHPARRP